MKATAIVAVVLIHSLPAVWAPETSRALRHLGQLLRFAVPTFFFASGFLYYQPAPISLATVGRRLRRILAPYFCVSVAALAYDAWKPGHAGTDSALQNLLFGAAFSPYYFVAVLAALIPLIWPMSRLPPSTVLGLLLLNELYGMLSRPHGAPLTFWLLRNPLLWGPWFVLGWLCGSQRNALDVLSARTRRLGLLACGVVLIAGLKLRMTYELSVLVTVIADQILILAAIVLLFLAGRSMAHVPLLVRRLSEWTYAIYLLHLFFVYAALDVLRPLLRLPPALDVPLAFVCGLAGALLVTQVLRSVLGPVSRDVIGA